MADQLRSEIAVLDDLMRAYEQDIDKLQTRLREARSRQTAIAARLESAENRVRLRSLMTSERVDEALARFDQLERRVDYAEGRADALSIAETGPPSLADEIAALAGQDKIDEELAAMKRALGHGQHGGLSIMDLTPFLVVCALFIGLPWVILHYITKWKTAAADQRRRATAGGTLSRWPAAWKSGWTPSNAWWLPKTRNSARPAGAERSAHEADLSELDRLMAQNRGTVK
jgi:hypothetical protein